MPDTPEVAISMLDINMRGDELSRYQEGRIAVKAKCPDGIESWLMVSVPVPTLLMCWMGIVWGWPKYVADIMTVTTPRAEVIYEGAVRLSMEFTPGPVENEAASPRVSSDEPADARGVRFLVRGRATELICLINEL